MILGHHKSPELFQFDSIHLAVNSTGHSNCTVGLNTLLLKDIPSAGVMMTVEESLAENEISHRCSVGWDLVTVKALATVLHYSHTDQTIQWAFKPCAWGQSHPQRDQSHEDRNVPFSIYFVVRMPIIECAQTPYIIVKHKSQLLTTSLALWSIYIDSYWSWLIALKC